MTDQNTTMLNLASLRTNLQKLMKPEILTGLAGLLEATGEGDGAFIERFKFFAEKNGIDCKYANMSKEFFLKDNADACAKAINWLYHNWSKTYE
jgi:hypothetical protein